MEPPKAELTQFIQAGELAKDLGVKRDFLLRLTYQGAPHIWLGRVLLFHGPSLAAWMLSKQISRVTEGETS